MEENTTAPTLFSHAVRSGVILGGIGIIITLLIYLIDPGLMVSFWMFLVLILTLALVVVFGIQYRNLVGGYLSFGDAFKHGLYTFIVAGLIGTLFNLLLHTVIDPDLKDTLTEITLENTESMMRSMGSSEDMIDKTIEDSRERTANQFTVTGIFTSFGYALIIYVILSLITGLIVRKKVPEEVV